jgi:hypothetical protein
MERGSQNRDFDFHTQYRLDRPVEKTWGGAAFGEKLLADSESLLLMMESVVKLQGNEH